MSGSLNTIIAFNNNWTDSVCYILILLFDNAELFLIFQSHHLIYAIKGANIIPGYNSVIFLSFTYFLPLSFYLLHAHTVSVSMYVHRLHMRVVVYAYMSGVRVFSRGR